MIVDGKCKDICESREMIVDGKTEYFCDRLWQIGVFLFYKSHTPMHVVDIIFNLIRHQLYS